MQNNAENVYHPEVPVLRFVAEYLHAAERAYRAAEKAPAEKHRFGYAPFLALRFAFVNAIENKRHDAHKRNRRHNYYKKYFLLHSNYLLKKLFHNLILS